MKKVIRMLSLVLMSVLSVGVMTSCSQEEEPGAAQSVSSNVIRFNATTDNAAGTRGLPTTSANYLTQVKDFKVWGYLSQSNVYYLGNGIMPYGIGAGIKIVNKNGKWDYSTATDMVYWPNEAMNFFAFTPTDGLHTSGPVVIYDVPTDCSKQQDFMYAFTDNITKNDNNGIVNLQFQHALSQVVFKAITKSSNLSVEITSIIIHNVFSEVSVNPETKNWYREGIATARKNNLLSSFKNFYVKFDKPYIVSVTDINNAVKLSNDDKAFLLPPEDLVPWDGKRTIKTYDPDDYYDNYNYMSTADGTDNYIEIRCKITSKNNSGVTYLLGSPTSYESTYVPLSGTWEAGKRYVYTLQFGGGKDADGNDRFSPITFSVKVSDWADSSSSVSM